MHVDPNGPHLIWQKREEGCLPVLQVQGQGVADKVNGTSLQSKMLVDIVHGGNVDIHATVSGGIIGLIVLDILEELLGSALLKETHQGTADSLHLCGWDLGDLAVTEHIGAGDLLKLEVASDVCVGQNLDELTVAHHELGDQVNAVVAILAKGSGSSFTIAELFEELSRSTAGQGGEYAWGGQKVFKLAHARRAFCF